MKINWKLILMVILLTVGLFSYKWLGEDNIIEENIENIIKNNTGVNIDFTPWVNEETF